MIQLIGLILFILGVLAITRGFRGHLLNTHPHCRGCGFDLHGLQLDAGTNCPECGRAVRTDAPTVRIGTRKRRPLLASVGCLVLMLGVVGLAWPKLSQIPSIQNIDWYAYFPEPLLLRLEAGGDKDALAELHSRLVPGELSDEGLQKLIDRSMAMLDDESVPWDERWGDVLLYALLTDQISETSRSLYLESLSVPVFYLHPLIYENEESFRSELVLYRNSRGLASLRMHDELHSKSPALYEQLLSLGYKVSMTPTAESNGVKLQPYGWTKGGHGGWTPIGNSQVTARASFRPKDDHRVIQVRIVVAMQILLNDEVLHEWEIQAESELRRVADGVEYASRPDSDGEVERLAKSLRLGPVRVPYSPEDALAIDDLKHYRISLGGIQTTYTTSIGLVGYLSFVDGDREIPYLGTVSVPMHDSRYQGTNSAHYIGWGYRIESAGDVEYGLNDFERDQAFWKKARLRGSVDVVFRPAPELLVNYPRIRVYLDQSVIFRGVKLEYQEIYQDPSSKRWGWQYSGGIDQPYHGVLLGD